ncbi:MAG: Selenocysteine-specific elongation factor [Phycisphaerae bacterium]|nr:Selenocysteine-specific elongation factor [Phycisphaerae bacterium]
MTNEGRQAAERQPAGIPDSSDRICPPAAQLVVGTAGHIDHGKSRLVWTLTGTDPDRLPEEKARGMTIDLGFAHATIDGCDVYFVDVPGHERFIRNMVAGAWGVDLALLVVAADDSVMPQTREHAELLALLGVRRCALVLTKLDLVDDGWADQVESEARELLASVGIAPLACLRTSAEDGRGLDELRRLLAAQAAARRTEAAPPRWFRLPVDRAFAVKGRGTVVTGTVAHGDLRVDAELELWPVGGLRGESRRGGGGLLPMLAAERRVRVRDIQSHSSARASTAGRTRAALNLAGLAVEDACRGHELASPGYVVPTSRFDAWLDAFHPAGDPARSRFPARLHVATCEVLATVRPLAPPAEPTPDPSGTARFAQIRTRWPVVVEWGQRFVLRDENGTRTIGGGAVLRGVAVAWSSRNPPDPAALERLRSGEPHVRVEETIRGAAWTELTAERVAALSGLADAAEAAAHVARLADAGRVVSLPSGQTRHWVHVAQLADAAGAAVARLNRALTENPRFTGVPRAEWPAWMPRACPARLRPALAEWLLTAGHVADADGFILPRGHRAVMSADDQRLFDTLLAEFRAGGAAPPTADDLTCRDARNARRIDELVRLAAARGRLVMIAPGVFLHAECYQAAVADVVAAIRTRGPLTVADIRTLLKSTRKFIVPLCEHLDAAGITKRSGDLRVLGPAGAAHA